MFAKQLLFLLALIVTGCGPTASTDTDTGNSAPNATPPAGGNNTQTLDGSGFSFQAPADWTVLSPPSGVAVSSPLDVKNPVARVSLVVSIHPAAGQTPKEFMASSLDAAKGYVDVESEAQMTVSGREATKLVTTQNDSRNVKVFVLLDAGVLALQATGTDEQVVALMPQIDTIIASIKLK